MAVERMGLPHSGYGLVVHALSRRVFPTVRRFPRHRRAALTPQYGVDGLQAKRTVWHS
ncbi:MAG: hypothetical protein M1820_010292, partial [Bogoriella megaspora]